MQTVLTGLDRLVDGYYLRYGSERRSDITLPAHLEKILGSCAPRALLGKKRIEFRYAMRL